MSETKIEINKWYTPAQIRDLIDTETSEALQLQGYVLQFDVMSGAGGMYRIIPWHQAAGGGVSEGARSRPQVTGRGHFKAPAAIVKRTNAQRVDSLMAKWLVGMKEAGGLPALLENAQPPEGSTTAEREDFYRRQAHEKEVLDDQIKLIVGEAWKSGRTEITADVVRQVAAHFLGQSEKEHEAKISKQITRHEN